MSKLNKIQSRIVTKKELALLLNISESTLTTYSRNGLPYVKNARGQANSYDVSEIVKWIVDKEVQKITGGSDTGETKIYNLKQQEARLKKNQADKAELESAKLRGELLDKEEVRDFLYKIAQVYGMHLDAIGGRLANELASVTEPAKIRQLLFEEGRHIRNETADSLSAYAESISGNPIIDIDDSESPNTEDYGFLG